MPDKYGWISVLERKPTKEDANARGEVLWYNRWSGCVVGDYGDYEDDETNWQPLPNPPARKVKKTLVTFAVLDRYDNILTTFEFKPRAREMVCDTLAAARVIRLTGEYEAEE